MSIHTELSRSTPPGPVALTIGVFDGVHLGHQHLLRRLRNEADRRRYRTAALTFTNHPQEVLQAGFHVRYLTTLEERERLLQRHGVDHVVAIAFTRQLSLYSAGEFISLLHRLLHMRGMVVGPDFALGHHRQGTLPVLRQMGSEMGFFVEQVEPLHQGDQVISSTAIRAALGQGDLHTANSYLGRPFRLKGTVERGVGRGHTLGFPTANVAVATELAVPADGVYATWALVDERWYPSATSIGVRPTFGGGSRTVEAFLLDFQGDLYQQPMTLDFAGRLRDELKFPSAEALAQQMHRDVEDARRVLAQVAPGQE